MNKENERDNIRKNEHKRLNKSKAIKISLSLFVVIIFVILFAVSLQISKITKTGVEVSDSLVESATEDVSTLLEEETEEVEFAENSSAKGKSNTNVADEKTEETEDEEIIEGGGEFSETSEVNDDGVSTVDDSSTYSYAADFTMYKQSTSEVTSRLATGTTNTKEYTDKTGNSIATYKNSFTSSSWTGFTKSSSAIVEIEFLARR